MKKSGAAVRKFNFFHVYDAPYIEQWLSDMAGEGLFLKRYGWLTATFDRREPEALVFAADFPYDDEDKEDPLADSYKALGWSLVHEDKEINLYSAPAGTPAPIWLQASARTRHYNAQSAVLMILAGFFIALFLVIGFADMTLLFNARSLLIMPTILIIFTFLELFSKTKARICMIRIHRHKSRNLPLRQHYNYNNLYRIRMATSIFLAAMMLLSVPYDLHRYRKNVAITDSTPSVLHHSDFFNRTDLLYETESEASFKILEGRLFIRRQASYMEYPDLLSQKEAHLHLFATYLELMNPFLAHLAYDAFVNEEKNYGHDNEAVQTDAGIGSSAAAEYGFDELYYNFKHSTVIARAGSTVCKIDLDSFTLDSFSEAEIYEQILAKMRLFSAG